MSQARRNVMLGTAGHVDHGKSALVKLLTGCETDTLAEEKQRGLTIDLGFAPCRMADQRIVGIVDVPGHVDFIRNMVAGAHGIDVVIFVVAADDGIMPKTHEHLHILTLMGLRHGLVALTKTDLVDAPRRNAVTEELRRLLAKNFLAGAPICPISNVTGEGLDGFFEALNKTVDACGDRSCEGPFRLWVEDAFTIRGAGTVITGIPTHGRVHVGDELRLLPAGLPGRVRRMQVYGEDAAEGRAGECAALNIPDLDHQSIRRGMVLCESNAFAPVTMAEAELRTLDSLKAVIEDNAEVQFHIGTAAAPARLAMLEDVQMSGGQKQFVQLRIDAPLPLAPGERFVVRANLGGTGGPGLTTIGGGQIVGLSDTRLRRKKQWTLDLLAARSQAVNDPLRWCEQMLRESKQPATVAGLQGKCWRRAEELAADLEHLRARRLATPVPGGGFLHSDVIEKTGQRLLAAIKAFHAANPQREGISREELLSTVCPEPALLEAALEPLFAAKQLDRNGLLLAAAGWNARVTDRAQRLCDSLLALLQRAGWAPPSSEELPAAAGESAARVSEALRLLAERGLVVRLDDRIWMHRDAIEKARQAALRLFARTPSFSTMEFRDALGVSRKFAVPLADYLDRTRFTVRCGNNRTPGAGAKSLLQPLPGAASK
ncbi:MAG: selenocysteine-specific translation elongation factor [Limisphaerales bacterium]